MSSLLFTAKTPFLNKHSPDHSFSFGFSHRFATVFGQSSVEWMISVRRPARALQRGNFNVELFARSFKSGQLPPADCSCLFRLVKYGREDGGKDCQTVAEMHVAADAAQNAKFQIRGDCPFIASLRDELNSGPANTLRMVLALTLPKKTFLAEKWLLPIPPTPLTMPSLESSLPQENLRLLCADGKELVVDIAALWRTAPGLRKILEATGDKLQVDVSEQAAKTVVYFMFTQTFLAPPLMSKALLGELDVWMKTCSMQEKQLLVTAVEMNVSMQLEQLDLAPLLELYLTAIELRMDRVETATAAVIIRGHYEQLHCLCGNSAPESDLKKKMCARTAHRGHSPLLKLDHMWVEQKDVAVVDVTEAK